MTVISGHRPPAREAPGRAWTARMIAPEADAGVGTRASYVAARFACPEGAEPVLHVSALGLYRAFVNGRRVGEDCLTPGWTAYDARIAYQSYAVADLVRPGENRIEIWLGDGWYRSKLLFRRDMAFENVWGEHVAAIAEVVDGDAVLARTDEAWEGGLLPVVKSGIYWGEDHDARLGVEPRGGVRALDFDAGLLVPHEAGPVRELDPLAPVESWRDEQGRTVFDFGQNAAGYPRIAVRGAPGATVHLDFSEVLGPGRAFDNRNFRDARAALSYGLKGEGVEVWSPAFTFMGYRYARARIEGDADLVEIASVPISSVPRVAGGFECGVDAVNRLVLNTVWSQRANFIEIPTDCPQRDERMGWTGDAQVFAGTACWLADCGRFLVKYLRDVAHEQRADGAIPHFSPDPTRMPHAPVEGIWAGSTGWGDAITVIPWQLYLRHGDTAVLREFFPAMLRWLDHVWSISDGPIVRPSRTWGTKGFTFGDWLQPIGDDRKPRPTIGDDCAATIYHAISTGLAARAAHVLGEHAEAERLAARHAEIRAAFGREYFAPSGRMAHNDQTSYALAFLHDLVPAEHREAARGYFRRAVEATGHTIGTGFIGTPALLPALSMLGLRDLAEKALLNRDVPGWLYQVERGATTIWERWDAIAPDGTIHAPEMNSYNHYAYGAVCQWLFEGVAGVQPTEEGPGFRRVRLAPVILPGLGHARMWHEGAAGRIEAGWRLDGDAATYAVTLPEGVEGVVPEGLYPGQSHAGRLGPGAHEIRFDLAGG